MRRRQDETIRGDDDAAPGSVEYPPTPDATRHPQTRDRRRQPCSDRNNRPRVGIKRILGPRRLTARSLRIGDFPSGVLDLGHEASPYPPAGAWRHRPRDHPAKTTHPQTRRTRAGSARSRVAEAFVADAFVGEGAPSPGYTSAPTLWTSSRRRRTAERDRAVGREPIEEAAVVADDDERALVRRRARVRAARSPRGRGGWSARRGAGS